MRNIYWIMIMLGAIVVTAMVSIMVARNRTAKRLAQANNDSSNGNGADNGSDLNGETEQETASRISSLTAGFGRFSGGKKCYTCTPETQAAGMPNCDVVATPCGGMSFN